MAEMRRVVTGHDEQGKAVLVWDSAIANLPETHGVHLMSLWSTDRTPADNAGAEDTASVADTAIPPLSNGSIFRIVDFPPANDAFMHRTETVDYAIIMSGEIDMLLDDSEVHLKAGDVLVQRGTNHSWANHGTETCRIAFILIDAEPLPGASPAVLR